MTHTLSATEALAAYRSRDLSPVEHLESLIARVESRDGQINAVMERLYDTAETASREAERRYARDAGEPLPPLLGLPVLAKEIHSMVGLGATRGSAAQAGVVATQNHPIIDRLEAAGAVIFGRTTTPEFSCATFTRSRAWGVTRNPWNPAFTPGGSSGGSAAAVAAGYAPVATASDIAGSTRLPAAFCGLVGFKTPFGRTAGLPPTNIDWYRGDHMLARTVADAALTTSAILGRDRRDQSSVGANGPYPTSFDTDLTGVRIALSPDLGNYRVEPEVAEGLRAAADALAAAGAEIEEVDLPWTSERITEVSNAHYGHLLAASIRDLARGDLSLLEPYTQYFVERTTAAARRMPIFEAAKAEAELQAQLMTVFAGHDALLTPTSAVGALRADDDYLDGIDLGGEHLPDYWQAHMTVPFNIANRCPAIAMPSGVAASTGVPTSVQIVTPPYEDIVALRLAAALEERLPFRHASLD